MVEMGVRLHDKPQRLEIEGERPHILFVGISPALEQPAVDEKMLTPGGN